VQEVEYITDSPFIHVITCFCELQDEWVPQENMDEEMDSIDNTDDDSDDDDVNAKERRPADVGSKSSETAMDRDSESDDDDDND